jgi:hypothetical protein
MYVVTRENLQQLPSATPLVTVRSIHETRADAQRAQGSGSVLEVWDGPLGCGRARVPAVGETCGTYRDVGTLYAIAT